MSKRLMKSKKAGGVAQVESTFLANARVQIPVSLKKK
jgi:hypothetical protein